MFNRFNRDFAFQGQGGRDWDDQPLPWMRPEGRRHWHGPHFFGMRGRGFFGPGGPRGPFGQEGPFGEVRRFFGRGDLKFALLELLQERPMHGYEMMKALEERSNGFYIPSAGSVYPILQMLEDRGFVTVNEADSKKVYSITDTGRAFLAENRKEEEPTFGGPPPRDRRGFGPRGHRWNNPELQALKTQAIEVMRLFSIAGRIVFHEPEKLPQLRTIIERTNKDLSEFIYSNGEKSEQNPPPPSAQQ